jgi:hypothetical protein
MACHAPNICAETVVLPTPALEVHHRDDRAFPLVGILGLLDELLQAAGRGAGQAQMRLDFLLEEAVQARLVDLVGDQRQAAGLGALDILPHRLRTHRGGRDQHDHRERIVDMFIVTLTVIVVVRREFDRNRGGPHRFVKLQQVVEVQRRVGDVDVRHDLAAVPSGLPQVLSK